MKRYLLCICCLLAFFTAFSQPGLLETGMRRNTAQTLMGSAKIDSYQREKTVYSYPDGVSLTIEYDKAEMITGFFWQGTQETVVVKTLEDNGYLKKDSATFSTPGLTGLLKREPETGGIIFRYVPVLAPEQAAEQKPVASPDPIPKERPFYGFTILGMRVWKPTEKQ